MSETSLDFSETTVLSFDCYGTLIDWETGISRALTPILDAHGISVSHDDLLQAFAREEARIEAGPYKAYAEVLADVVAGLGHEWGFRPSPADCAALAGSLPGWPPFPDTVDALRRLSCRFKLAILSNVDDELFAGTAEHLEVPFDTVVTAQQVGRYKPALANFESLLERLAVPPSELVHCAQSPFHDLAPARQLGLRSVWIDRSGVRAAGLSLPTAEQGDAVLTDLSSLADATGC